jgi:uncharacterized membrane protein YhaH (DUF805 family)
MSLKDKLFSFEGRLRRSDWWVLGILVGLVQSLTHFGSARLLELDRYALTGGIYPVVGDPWPALLHSAVISLLFMWPQLALTVKRAHDISRNAWSFAFVWIVTGALAYWPVQNFAVVDPITPQADLWSRMEPWVIACGALAGLLYVFIRLGFIDGRPGPNRFGPSPKLAQRPAFEAPGGAG